MPLTPNQVHIDTYATNVAIKYSQEASDFIAGQVFPQVPVTKKSDFYLKFPKGYFMRDEMEIRPLGGRPAQAGYQIEKGHYNCEEWSLEHPIDDRVRENADVPINPDMRAAEFLTEKALIHRDAEWVTKFFSTGVWTTEQKGVAKESEAKTGEKFVKFSNYTEGEPIKFFHELVREMKEKTSKKPNVLVLGYEAYVALINHPKITDRIKYTEIAIVDTALLARLLGIDRVVVTEAVRNTAPEGKADKVEFIGSPTSAMLAYAAPNPSIEIPSAGYIFGWTGLLPGLNNALGGVLYKGREELAHSDIYQIRATYDMEVTAQDLGQFLTECV